MWNEFKQRMNCQATLKGFLLRHLVSLWLFFLRDTFYCHLGMANLTPNPTTPCYNQLQNQTGNVWFSQQEWASRPKRQKILKTLRQQSLKEARLPLISGRMCECVCVCVWTCAHSVAPPCQTLCDHMDFSSPGSSVHGISQARILVWVAISSSR